MEIGKLYKNKNTKLIVKCTSPSYNDYTFGGIVIVEDEIHKIGLISNGWLVHCFEEYNEQTSTQIGGTHYSSKSIQPIDYILANELNFCEGNVIKYITRYKHKNGVEDLLKAKHYLEMLISNYENKESI